MAHDLCTALDNREFDYELRVGFVDGGGRFDAEPFRGRHLIASLEQAVEYSDERLVALVLTGGKGKWARVWGRHKKAGGRTLQSAAADGEIAIVKLLCGTNIPHFDTVVGAAARGGHEDVVKYLIGIGISPGECALAGAILANKPRVVKILIGHGCHVGYHERECAAVVRMKLPDG